MLLSLLFASVLGRVIVPFQYAWRFHYGDDPSSGPRDGPGAMQSAFEIDLANYSLCSGVEHAPNRFSLKDCHLACSYDPDCLVWQAFPIVHGRMCYQAYTGMNVTCTPPASDAKPSFMGGGRRAVSPSPAFRTDYSFATADASAAVDSSWVVVDAPHDFIAEYGNFTDNQEDVHHGYLPRNVSWYRKHFNLPAAWQSDGGATYVHFEGVFHHATIFLNGKYIMSHECGYTGFDVRIDNATRVRYGAGAARENVLTVRADASWGSGHWYEGGGIYRPVQLEHIAATHITRNGLFVPPQGTGASIFASAELESTAASGASRSAKVRFSLFALDGGAAIATATSTASTVPAAGRGTTAASVRLSPPPGSIKKWTIQSPTQYMVLAEVIVVGGAVVDAISTTVGFRTTAFSGEDGRTPFTLNGDAVRFRGFSHHNSIGALGVAIPERIQLFRVQASRALGSNIWRMSHNPYDTALYDLLDATGQMCWDENRDYGAKYGGGVYAIAMRDMVKRDRNHASVIIWSFCNEAECAQFDSDYSGLAFRAAAKGVDPTRPVAANGALSQTPTLQLDVQGGSHWSGDKMVTAHAQNATKPLVLSECCSCNSQRDLRSMDGDCISAQNSPGLLPFVTGSLGVWTLMDYFGEPAGQPHAWPHVSCDFGQFDIAGFPKPHAYWYAANWLQGFNASNPGRPALPSKTVARILALPGGAPASQVASQVASPATTISAVTTAPFAELFLDGVSHGVLATRRDERGEILATEWGGRAGGKCTGADPFSTNASGVQCHGLVRASAGDSSASACANACCADSAVCDTWQLATGHGAGGSSKERDGCWIGRAEEGVGKCGLPKQPNAQWVGGQRTVAPTPAPGAFRNATLVAYSGNPHSDAAVAAAVNVLAVHSLFAPSTERSGYRLALTIDVPSASTGTGTALLLDGRDTAFVRCAIIDSSANDALVASASDRITWRVVSGPGRTSGVANGNRSSHEWLKSTSVNAYLGLARGTFRVTQDCTSAARASCATIDADASRAPTAVEAAVADCDVNPIVVEASAPGFDAVQISIPVSVDAAKDSPLAIARATGESFTNGFSYLNDFVG